MAVNILAPQTYTEITLKMEDINLQTYTISFVAQYATGETDVQFAVGLQGFVANLEAVSNARLLQGVWQNIYRRVITTTKTATDFNFATIDQVMLLGFTRVNPLRPELKVTKNFPIPAYDTGKASLPAPDLGKPNMTDGDMTGIRDWLNAHLGYRNPADNNLYFGFTFGEGVSGGISLPDVVDQT